MSLLKLPNELLCAISEHLQIEKDISAFARVNSQLYSLSIANLYQFNTKYSKSSALVWAATNGNLETASKALKERASSVGDKVEIKCIIMAAMVLAAGNNHEKMVRLLNQNGASPHSYDRARRRNAMEAAAEHGHTNVVKLLLKLGANPAAGLGDHPFAIQFAAMGGHVEIVRLLIEAGEDPDSCSGRPGGGSYTPLQAAALKDNVELAKMLLAKGASVNLRSSKGDTPLELATMNNSVQCVKLLLGAGAKVYGKHGRYVRCPALELAMRPSREQCLELLKNETVHDYSREEDDRFAEE